MRDPRVPPSVVPLETERDLQLAILTATTTEDIQAIGHRWTGPDALMAVAFVCHLDQADASIIRRVVDALPETSLPELVWHLHRVPRAMAPLLIERLCVRARDTAGDRTAVRLLNAAERTMERVGSGPGDREALSVAAATRLVLAYPRGGARVLPRRDSDLTDWARSTAAGFAVLATGAELDDAVRCELLGVAPLPLDADAIAALLVDPLADAVREALVSCIARDPVVRRDPRFRAAMEASPQLWRHPDLEAFRVTQGPPSAMRTHLLEALRRSAPDWLTTTHVVDVLTLADAAHLRALSPEEWVELCAAPLPDVRQAAVLAMGRITDAPPPTRDPQPRCSRA
jgi:hypothetical protein